jgi:hypothetical protein
MRVTDKPSAFTENAVGAYANTPEATNVGFDFDGIVNSDSVREKAWR